ncbi:MAG: cysteine desulfurase [Parcubacteria group bacterium Gr01-1014_91]|nr:MAG: cysteine desulfurase [Parcubacteria group bacterium Gr01-1014_91]
MIDMWWKKRTYFDYAAGASANPSSPHEEGRCAKQMLEDARLGIARLLEVQSDDVIFTSGATEANALAILGILKKGDHALYLPSAHASIVENMKLASERGVDVEPLPIKDFSVDCDKLEKMLRSETKMVSIDAVCGETGVVWNTREVASTLAKARSVESKNASARAARPIQHAFSNSPSRAFLHVDASQAPMTEKITRAHFSADLLTLDASKVGAVRGIGALVAHRTIPITPLYRGGGQERGLRSGSEAPELARSFARALTDAATCRESFRASAEEMRALLVAKITATIPNVYINEGRSQAPHILNLSLPTRDTDYLVALLDEAGFAVSTRSACETDSEDGSRAVLALTGDQERARATLRVSWGHGVRPRELEHFAKALAETVLFVDKNNQR